MSCLDEAIELSKISRHQYDQYLQEIALQSGDSNEENLTEQTETSSETGLSFPLIHPFYSYSLLIVRL